MDDYRAAVALLTEIPALSTRTARHFLRGVKKFTEADARSAAGPKGSRSASQQSVLYQWTKEIRKNMQHLSKPQTKALAAFSAGIAKAEGCGLNAASKKLPFAGNPTAVERRMQRFIASDRIDNAESCRATAK